MGSTVDERTKMRRVAEMHVGIGEIQIDTMCFERIVSMELSGDNVLVIEAQKYTKPLRLQTHCDPTISDAWKRMFASIDMCQTVIAWNLEWILWVTESEYLQFLTRSMLTISEEQGIEINEIAFSEPNPRHRFECFYNNDGFTAHSERCRHSVITLTSTSGSEQIVSDPSYAQYSFERGVEDLHRYKSAKLHPLSLTINEGLGTSVKRATKQKMSRRRRAREVIVTKTVNNIVYQEVKRLGGPETFLGLGAQEFAKARDRIFARVRKELERLRRELDHLRYRQVRNKAAFYTLRRECGGRGNRACRASYKRQVKATS